LPSAILDSKRIKISRFSKKAAEGSIKIRVIRVIRVPKKICVIRVPKKVRVPTSVRRQNPRSPG
jgi:hypothetical protein